MERGPPDDILLAIWHRALEPEIGICVTVTKGERRWFVNSLYRVRQEANDPQLEEIILFQPPQEDEIFLCKKQTNL
jgi:hypothetical protein